MRILLIYAGGAPFLQPFDSKKAKDFLQEFVDLQLVAEVDITVLHNTTGADLSWNDGFNLARCIQDNYQNYEGFVVLHSIDNVLYIANLVEFAFSGLSKPIIFTGMTPLDETASTPTELHAIEKFAYKEMSLRTNLITALQLAIMNCAGVYVAFGPKVIRAVRALEQPHTEGQPFFAIHEEPVAKVQFGVQVQPHAPKRSDTTAVLCEKIVTNIAILQNLPKTDNAADPATHFFPEDTQAIILQGYRQQLLPSHLNLPDHLPVIIQSSRTVGAKLPTNWTVLQNITWPALLAKTIVGLGAVEPGDFAALRTRLLTNQTREFFNV